MNENAMLRYKKTVTQRTLAAIGLVSRYGTQYITIYLHILCLCHLK